MKQFIKKFDREDILPTVAIVFLVVGLIYVLFYMAPLAITSNQ